MDKTEVRLQEIEDRVYRNGVPGSIAITPSDVAYLLTELRKRVDADKDAGDPCDCRENRP